MARIVAEITMKLNGFGSDKDEKENKFFDWVTKQNPKTFNGKEDALLLEEWIRQMEKIFVDVKVLDNRRVSIGGLLSYQTG